MKFMFDIDGVVRWLSNIPRGGVVPLYWDEPCPNGQSLIEYINNEPSILTDAPPLPYLEVIKRCDCPFFLSHQQNGWKRRTDVWLQKHVGNLNFKWQYVENADDKMKVVEDWDAYIVEDSPNFPKEFYRRVVLIDWPYNQGIDCFARVRTVEELAWILGVKRDI